MFQFVTNSKKKVNSFFNKVTQKYVLCLLLSIGKKNCRAMSDDLGLSYNSIYQYFDYFEEQKKVIQKFFVDLVKHYSTNENPGVLIVDTTQLKKFYAKKLECISYDFSTSLKLVIKGISCVTVVWTNGKIVIPLDFDFWIRKKDIKNNDLYRKKTCISRELICKWKDKISFKYIPLDGEYANEDFMKFLNQEDFKYSMRIQRSRVVAINGIEAALKNHPFFQLKRNEHYKSAKGTYKGITAHFTCQKRKAKNNTTEVVFIVSNLENLTPKEHILAYDFRWPIEKMFRTLKQSLGIQDCQSNFRLKQEAHIFASFLAFLKLEIIKISKKKKSPEQVLKIIRRQNRAQTKIEFDALEGFLM